MAAILSRPQCVKMVIIQPCLLYDIDSVIATSHDDLLATSHADYLRLTHCSQGDLEMIFKGVIFLLIFQIDNLSNSYETAFRRMSQNPFQNKLTLVQVMAWCQC